MKTTLVIVLGIVSVFSTSCSKEYTCSCSNSIGSQTYEIGTVKAGNQKKATSLCAANAQNSETCVGVEN